MEYIPNEILAHVISHMHKDDIPTLRLVSHRFNQLTIPFVQKLFRVDFGKVADMVKFVSVFQHNQAFLRFHKFGFRGNILCNPELRGPLKQFCAKMGEFVTSWEILDSSYAQISTIFLENVTTLLENCINIQEISCYISQNGMTPYVAKIPLLIKLRKINIHYYSEAIPSTSDYTQRLNQIITNKPNHKLLNRIIKNTPNRPNISVKSGLLTQAANLLNQLNIPNNRIAEVEWHGGHQIPASPDDLKEMCTTQLRIVVLHLLIWSGENVDSRSMPMWMCKQTENVAAWIGKLKFVRKLTITFRHSMSMMISSLSSGSIPFPIQHMATLQFLEVSCIFIPAVPTQKIELPALTVLKSTNCIGTSAANFSSSVFPNVKFAQISLETQEEIENWPLVIPNVENLIVNSKSLEGIFRFPKLRKLDITINTYILEETGRLHWKQLTAGAEYMSNTAVLDSPVEPRSITNSVDSFGNLPFLNCLRFSNEGVDCWKGLIYASRIGELKRLQWLRLSMKEFVMEERYLEELRKYHEAVKFDW